MAMPSSTQLSRHHIQTVSLFGDIWRWHGANRLVALADDKCLSFFSFIILNDAVTVPLNTHICSMHEQRALRWANNRIRAKAYRNGGGYFSVHTAHDTRSVETKNPSKKSLLPGLEATPVTQRWHLGYNFSACLRGVRARAQRCKGRARAGECSAGFCFWNPRLSPSSLDPPLFLRIHKTVLAAPNRSSSSPVLPPTLHLEPKRLNLPPINTIQRGHSRVPQSRGVMRVLDQVGGTFFFARKANFSAASAGRSGGSLQAGYSSSLNLAL